MIKVLIVDDEQIERDGLQAILHKGYPELVIRQAQNGRIAVEMMEEFRPDLVLMDIKMPGMNGLEAVERISADYPETKFVMVTAYDTFEFARQAITLGVKDYLLKPSKASEIIDTVGRVLNQIEAERLLEEERRQQQDKLLKALPLAETDVVTQLLFDHVHEVHLDELVGLLDIQPSNETFVMLVMLPPDSEPLYGAIKTAVRRLGAMWVGALYGRQLPIIVFRDPEKSYRSQAVTLARSILAVAGTGDRSGWFVGIGNAYDSLEQIRQSYQEALIASADLTLPVKYRFYADVPAVREVQDGEHARQQERQFLDHVRLGEWEEVHRIVMDVIRHCENEGASLLQAQQRALEKLWIVSRVLSEMGMETRTPLFSFQAQDYRQLRAETGLLIDRLRQTYAERQERMAPDTIQRIRQYIMDHSHENISLEMIGKMVDLSPFYISKMFKDQLGVNYIDFLTECRIEKAKKMMLADPDISLKEIAYEVGYHDPNYFSKVFKKMCDVSPTEYRRMLFGKKA
ncbi:two-component system response regulator [Paenibacillus sp. 32O-W]|uniref:response regulator n=1 Tax=Paenibacillus sp. 32O-W TaxID=1695218 RepID=UPI0007211963|nr:response regulator [Paenibacillus sp. 32O-W]ALS26248.1 two-component system response regulator [Paenibacillus sp. 32O-W]